MESIKARLLVIPPFLETAALPVDKLEALLSGADVWVTADVGLLLASGAGSYHPEFALAFDWSEETFTVIRQALAQGWIVLAPPPPPSAGYIRESIQVLEHGADAASVVKRVVALLGDVPYCEALSRRSRAGAKRLRTRLGDAPGGLRSGSSDLDAYRRAVSFSGYFWHSNSLGHIHRGWAQGLKEAGVAVHVPKPSLVPAEREFLVHQFPQHAPFGEHYSIYFYPEDLQPGTRGRSLPCIVDCADSWRLGRAVPLPYYNQRHRTIVFSDSCLEFFKHRGVRNVVKVTPGVDTEYLDSLRPYRDLSAVFRRGAPFCRIWGDEGPVEAAFFMGGFLQAKKGVGAFIRAWKLFNSAYPQCRLYIHNSVSYWGQSDISIREIQENVGSARVSYSEKPIRDHEFLELMATMDILCQGSHCEGFGLIPLQAMAMGKPVVLTGGHGFLEYADTTNASLIEARSVEHPFEPGFPWFEYTPEAGAAALEDAFLTRYSESRALARRRTAQAFSWERAANALRDGLEENGRPFRCFAPPVKRQLVSIVVPFRRSGRGTVDVRRLLDSLATVEDWPHEIVLCDDGSWPALRISDDYRNLRLIDLGRGEGAAATRNVGVMHARGEYVLFLDADIEVTEPILRSLISRLGYEEKLVLAPQLLHPDGSIQSGGGMLWVDPDSQRFRSGHRFDGEQSSLLDANLECALPYAPSAALFCRRAFLMAQGLFSEEYPAALWEDIDFCFNVWRQGGAVRYVPQVRLIHHCGSFTGADPEQSERTYDENEQIFRRRFPDALSIAESISRRTA